MLKRNKNGEENSKISYTLHDLDKQNKSRRNNSSNTSRSPSITTGDLAKNLLKA